MRRSAAVVLAVAVCASGQVDQELARAAKNPNELVRFANAHKEYSGEVIAKSLGIALKRNTRCFNACSAELITVLDPNEAIVLLEGMPDDLYLRYFPEPGGKWRAAGAFAVEIRNHPRRHHMSREGGIPFLVVHSQGPRGSGIESEVENWLDLSREDFEPVLSILSSGQESPFNFAIGREFSQSVSWTRDARVHLDIRFDVGGFEAAHREYTAVYEPGSDGKYRLAKVTPEMAPEFYEGLVFTQDAPKTEQMVRYIFPELKLVAKGGLAGARESLKQILSYTKDTPEVRELKALLSAPAP